MLKCTGSVKLGKASTFCHKGRAVTFYWEKTFSDIDTLHTSPEATVLQFFKYSNSLVRIGYVFYTVNMLCITINC